MNDKKEFILCVSAFLFLLSIVDIGIMKYTLTHVEMNGIKFNTVGMMEYTNPTDHRKLYLLIYEKGETK